MPDERGGLATRRTGAGAIEVYYREHDPTDHALLSPIVDKLKQAIELIGTEEDQAFTRALVVMRGAAVELQRALTARGELEDPERKEALAQIRRAIKDLQDVQKKLR